MRGKSRKGNEISCVSFMMRLFYSLFCAENVTDWVSEGQKISLRTFRPNDLENLNTVVVLRFLERLDITFIFAIFIIRGLFKIALKTAQSTILDNKQHKSITG